VPCMSEYGNRNTAYTHFGDVVYEYVKEIPLL
jgi:hypothetical protein